MRLFLDIDARDAKARLLQAPRRSAGAAEKIKRLHGSVTTLLPFVSLRPGSPILTRRP